MGCQKEQARLLLVGRIQGGWILTTFQAAAGVSPSLLSTALPQVTHQIGNDRKSESKIGAPVPTSHLREARLPPLATVVSWAVWETRRTVKTARAADKHTFAEGRTKRETCLLDNIDPPVTCELPAARSQHTGWSTQAHAQPFVPFLRAAQQASKMPLRGTYAKLFARKQSRPVKPTNQTPPSYIS